jgi:hypothetical protein
VASLRQEGRELNRSQDTSSFMVLPRREENNIIPITFRSGEATSAGRRYRPSVLPSH